MNYINSPSSDWIAADLDSRPPASEMKTPLTYNDAVEQASTILAPWDNFEIPLRANLRERIVVGLMAVDQASRAQAMEDARFYVGEPMREDGK